MSFLMTRRGETGSYPSSPNSTKSESNNRRCKLGFTVCVAIRPNPFSYLIPIFTHHGRPITELSRCCPACCLPLCSKCKPAREQLISDESDEEEKESLVFESSESESEDEDQVISFRNDKEFTVDVEIGDTDEV